MILASASPIGLTLAISAAVAYSVSALGAVRLGTGAARVAVWLAWLVHGLLLVFSLFGTELRFGFAPALSVTAWLIVAVYAVEGHLYPLMETRWTLSVLGAVAVLLGILFPGKLLHASASVWLPVHWALGIASYGLFGAAVVHAWFMTQAEERFRLAADPHSGMPLLTMERLTFRFVSVGFALLSATLVVGLLFETRLYGSSTGLKLDHKTAFSILSWLTFAVLLVGRARLGWRGKRAIRVLYIGAGLLLLAYVGSRFVLEIVLGRAA